jgi:hypothetical protein
MRGQPGIFDNDECLKRLSDFGDQREAFAGAVDFEILRGDLLKALACSALAKIRQRDRDARWTVKVSMAKERSDGTKPPADIAIPTFGYQNHIAIDRRFGLNRKWTATNAATYVDERRLGRHRLQVGGERGMPGEVRLLQPYPPQEVEWPSQGRDDATDAREQFDSPLARRACLRRT